MRSEKVKVDLKPEHQYKEMRQVLVKAHYTFFLSLRIWPTTYLICNQSGKRSKLIFSENICLAPKWLPAWPNHEFYLIFEGLPKGCHSFDLFEEITEPGNFHIRNIARNESDVYDICMG